jgi:predicted DNA binding CopG/RHH family protein
MIWSPEYGRKILAHRFSFETAYGQLPANGLVLHSCDNPACVNPKHLRLGSHRENVADMDERNRRVPPSLKGNEIHNAKLTDDTVIAIRKAYLDGDQIEDICKTFGVPETSIRDYTSGRSWQHLFDVPDAPTFEQLKAEAARRTRNNTRLSEDDVRTIRKRLAKGEMGKALAEEYGVHKATISDIKLRKRWADLS